MAYTGDRCRSIGQQAGEVVSPVREDENIGRGNETVSREAVVIDPLASRDHLGQVVRSPVDHPHRSDVGPMFEEVLVDGARVVAVLTARGAAENPERAFVVPQR